MSSKLRLSDIALSDDDLVEEFLNSDESPRLQRKPKTRIEKRNAIDNYMEARALKRNISENYESY